MFEKVGNRGNEHGMFDAEARRCNIEQTFELEKVKLPTGAGTRKRVRALRRHTSKACFWMLQACFPTVIGQVQSEETLTMTLEQRKRIDSGIDRDEEHHNHCWGFASL